MEYRRFGRLDWKGSALGFGAMRLPTLDGRAANIDEPQVFRMIEYAIGHGVNYLDTAYPYHEGQSEQCVGRVLKDGGFRDKIMLATKLLTRTVKSPADFDKMLNEQLRRLQTDMVDIYLLHGLNHETWPKVRDMGVMEWMEKAVAGGRIRHIGFSFHDDFPTFKGIVDEYHGWTMCQIQYNYMDTEYQAGTAGLKYASGKGLAVVAMEPIRGGKLAQAPPPKVKEILTKSERPRALAEWALQWLWDQPEVSVVLSGMTAMQHVIDNVQYAEKSATDALSVGELRIIDGIQTSYRKLSPIPCTSCQYCMPCPNGVRINRIFELYNEVFMYGDKRVPRMRYGQLREDQRGSQCTECGECEEACPQTISIAEWLKTADELLAGVD